MVTDDDARACVEMLSAGDDVEFHARGEAHAELEGAGGQVLGQAVFANKAEEDGDDDAIGRADEKGEVGGKEAGDEGGIREENGSAREGEE